MKMFRILLILFLSILVGCISTDDDEQEGDAIVAQLPAELDLEQKKLEAENVNRRQNYKIEQELNKAPKRPVIKNEREDVAEIQHATDTPSELDNIQRKHKAITDKQAEIQHLSLEGSRIQLAKERISNLQNYEEIIGLDKQHLKIQRDLTKAKEQLRQLKRQDGLARQKAREAID
jgi:hypothetical protein